MTALSRLLSVSSSCFCSHFMVLPIAVLTRFEGGAAARRFFSAVIMSTTWRRRTTRASSSCVSSSRSGRTWGRIRSAKSASTAASMASVFASCPVAFAKSLTWRGFTATTGRDDPASAATALRSSPPVTSSTISFGEISPSLLTSCCIPSVESRLTRLHLSVRPRCRVRPWKRRSLRIGPLGVLPPLQSVVGVTGVALPCECGLEALASVRALSQSRHDDQRSPTISRTSGLTICRAVHLSLPPPAALASVAWPCLAARGGMATGSGGEPPLPRYKG